MLFSEKGIPAQTTETVNRLALYGRIPQSVLLTGGSHALREKCSQQLAKAVLCSHPVKGQPCNKCGECIRVKAGSHPDIIRLVPEKDKKTVSVKAVRTQITESLYIAPNEAENKVYIIPDADELSELVQNTLLKTIEEPPPYVMFLLEANQREQLLTTVISRCTELSLGAVGTGRVSAEDNTAVEIAKKTAEALFRGGEYGIMEALAGADKNRALMKKIAANLQLIVRDALVEGSHSAHLTEFERQAIGLSTRFSVSQLLNIKAVCDDIQLKTESNANENLLLSYFCSALANIKS